MGRVNFEMLSDCLNFASKFAPEAFLGVAMGRTSAENLEVTKTDQPPKLDTIV